VTAIEAMVPTGRTEQRGLAWRAFVAILWRDIFVTGREFWVFLAQVALQPLFMLFVFAKVLGSLTRIRE